MIVSELKTSVASLTDDAAKVIVSINGREGDAGVELSAVAVSTNAAGAVVLSLSLSGSLPSDSRAYPNSGFPNSNYPTSGGFQNGNGFNGNYQNGGFNGMPNSGYQSNGGCQNGMSNGNFQNGGFNGQNGGYSDPRGNSSHEAEQDARIAHLEKLAGV